MLDARNVNPEHTRFEDAAIRAVAEFCGGA
jgi:hypothetical protein